MSDFDNTDRGVLFKNDRKEADSHPDYKGHINVDGTEYWLSAWIKHSQKGQTFMSLSIKLKEEAPKRQPRRDNGAVAREERKQAAASNREILDDDIPF